MFGSTSSIWIFLIGFACLTAVANWRKAIYVGILVDVLRDPVRKLIPGKPIYVTLSGAVVWLLIVLVAAVVSRRDIRQMLRTYPQLRSAMRYLLIAMIPAAIVSVLLQPNGILLAVIGGATYLIPVLGIGAGFAMSKRKDAILKVLEFYVIVNSIMLIGVILQYVGSNFPALGGIDFKWIRYRDGYIVDLMCGWYRSPDIMGLHAAHVIMFGLLLAAEKRSGSQPLWLTLALWAAFCVLVSGRRKMIGVPLVFIGCFMTLAWLYGVHRIGRFATVLATSAAIGAGLSFLILGTDQSNDYTDYASSLFTEGAGRTSEIVVGSTLSTVNSLGIFGSGLGSATQGRNYVSQGTGSTRGWQEDGISRLIAEFGLIGVMFVVAAFVLVIRSVLASLRMIAANSRVKVLQLGLFSIVAGNLASFMISHQQYSGDPVNALFVTLILGMAFAVPNLQQIGSQTQPVAALTFAQAPQPAIGP